MSSDWEFIVGALVGVGTTVLVRYIFVLVDEASSRYNELCDLISAAADTATEYWLIPGTDEKIKAYEARIHGFQTRVILLFVLLTDKDWSLKALAYDEFDAFLDALTGGNFEVLDRLIDIDRAKEVQGTAAKLIDFLRRHRRKRWFVV